MSSSPGCAVGSLKSPYTGVLPASVMIAAFICSPSTSDPDKCPLFAKATRLFWTSSIADSLTVERLYRLLIDKRPDPETTDRLKHVLLGMLAGEIDPEDFSAKLNRELGRPIRRGHAEAKAMAAENGRLESFKLIARAATSQGKELQSVLFSTTRCAAEFTCRSILLARSPIAESGPPTDRQLHDGKQRSREQFNLQILVCQAFAAETGRTLGRCLCLW
jgi:hypothetical protein